MKLLKLGLIEKLPSPRVNKPNNPNNPNNPNIVKSSKTSSLSLPPKHLNHMKTELQKGGNGEKSENSSEGSVKNQLVSILNCVQALVMAKANKVIRATRVIRAIRAIRIRQYT